MARLTMEALLAAVGVLEPNAYGVTLSEKLGDISYGEMYALIDDAERLGYVATHYEEGGAELGGRHKKMVELTGKRPKQKAVAPPMAGLVYA